MDFISLTDLDNLDRHDRTLSSPSDPSHLLSNGALSIGTGVLAVDTRSTWSSLAGATEPQAVWPSPSRDFTRTWGENHDSTAMQFDDYRKRSSSASDNSEPSLTVPPGQYESSPAVSIVTPQDPTPQDREEDQWQMYLTASLSNPLNALEFGEPLDHQLTHHYVGIQDQYIANVQPVASSPGQIPHGPAPPVFGQGGNYQSIASFGPAPPPMSSTSRQDPLIDQLYGENHMAVPGNDTANIPLSTSLYPSLLNMTPPRFDFGSTRFSAIDSSTHPFQQMQSPTSSPLCHGSPLPRHDLRRGLFTTTPGTRRGLVGWTDPPRREHSPLSSGPTGLLGHRKRLRSESELDHALCLPPSMSAFPSPTATSADSTRERQVPVQPSIPQRSESRPRRAKSKSIAFDEESDYNEDVDYDSDDYHPSSSPSAEPEDDFDSPPYPRLQMITEPVNPPPRKKSKRGRGKAIGSAALALAVVSHLSKAGNPRAGSLDFDPSSLDFDSAVGIRKRKNTPIPLPIPVPNLNKKSRGRKVPYVANVQPTGGVEKEIKKDDQGEDASATDGSYKPSGRGSRKKGSPTPSSTSQGLDGERTYVCDVAGCGKCFVRGEHLKRHVRSIHTHDKPHVCPYEGCDKSFSRRDNLGQHVRIHLQP